MFDNFIFSFGIAAPIFAVMCIGYILKTKKLIDDQFVTMSNQLVFKVALPIKLFSDVYKTSFDQYFDLRFIVFIVLGTILSVGIVWILGGFIINKKSQLGAFIQGAFRGNFVYIGLSIMENITGSIGLKGPLAVAIIVPLYNILAVTVLTFTGESKNLKGHIKNSILNIIKNPLIIAIFLGIGFSLTGMELPLVFTRTFGYFGSMATPLALLAIGGAFNLQKSVGNWYPCMIASMLKLIIIPLIAVIVAVNMKFSSEDVLLIYVIFGVPTAVTSYIMTAAMNGDGDLASNIIMMTTVLSIASITLFIFTFKTIGII